MFTGIIEKCASFVKLELSGESARLSVRNPFTGQELVIGESIAVNGTCLTLVSYNAKELVFNTLTETLRRTNLGELHPGDLLNLERALRLGDRLGGHLVSGHIDTVGKVVSVCRQGKDLELTVAIPEKIDFPRVPKGSVTINGVSLTIARLDGQELTVCLIPHTWQETNLQALKPGSLVNLEADMLGKYVEAYLSGLQGSQSRITMDMLTEAGF